MSNKEKNMQGLKWMILIGILVITVIGGITFNMFKEGYYREWIIMIVSLSGATIGGIFTMTGVILTLNREEDGREKEEQMKIDRIKVILNYEIESFMVSFQKEFIMYSHDKVLNISENAKKIKRLNFGELEEWNKDRFNLDKLYKLDSDFKKYMYDLIVLDGKEDSKELIEWYKAWSMLNNKEIVKDNKAFAFVVEALLDEQYLKIFKYIQDSEDLINSDLEGFIGEGKDEMELVGNIRIKKDINLEKSGCSENGLRILKYLRR